MLVQTGTSFSFTEQQTVLQDGKKKNEPLTVVSEVFENSKWKQEGKIFYFLVLRFIVLLISPPKHIKNPMSHDKADRNNIPKFKRLLNTYSSGNLYLGRKVVKFFRKMTLNDKSADLKDEENRLVESAYVGEHR